METGAVKCRQSFFDGGGSIVDVNHIRDYQQSLLPSLDWAFKAATEVLRRETFGGVLNAMCVVTSAVFYRYPDRPAVICGEPIITRTDDYAITLKRDDVPTSVYRDLFGLGYGDNDPSVKTQCFVAVYPNTTKYLAGWIRNIEGIIDHTKIFAAPVSPSSTMRHVDHWRNEGLS